MVGCFFFFGKDDFFCENENYDEKNTIPIFTIAIRYLKKLEKCLNLI